MAIDGEKRKEISSSAQELDEEPDDGSDDGAFEERSDEA